MTARELFVLGTASQVPTRHRNHNGFFLRWDHEGILFDPGEGAQRQLTLAGLSVSNITRVCITHFHGDHCLGLPGIIQRLSLEKAPLVKFHYPASGQKYFERLRKASIFAGLEKIEAWPIYTSGVIAENESFSLEAIALDHEVDCFGYRVQEAEQQRISPELLAKAGLKQGPLVGELLRKGQIEENGRTIYRHEVCELRTGQSFAFVMDSRPCQGASDLARGVDLLVCESTFLSSEAETAKLSGHMTALDAGTLARDAGARRLVIGHFSQRYEDAQSMLQEASSMHHDVLVAQEPDQSGNDPTRHRIAVPERTKV